MSEHFLSREFAKSLSAEIESRREEIVELCSELVSALSINPDGDTREVAEVVFRFLEARNLKPTKISAVETMPSVMAAIDSGKPGKHMVLNVHLDTMPAGDESLWTVPPFKLTRRDGKLYGLGMGNMKGAVAAMLHAFDFLNKNKSMWAGKVTLTAVSDEVVFGNNGAAHILREHPELLADGLICGEGPGFQRLANGEKGVLWLRLSTVATGGHSSSVVRGESASARIAKAVSAVDSLTGVDPKMLSSTNLVRTLKKQRVDRDLGDGRTLTANVGTISSGSFIGQVATSAQAEIDLRVPPGMTIDQTERLVREVIEQNLGVATIQVQRIKGWDPNVTEANSSLVKAWFESSALADVPKPELAIRLPASDASRWRQQGVDALCYGPQPTESAGIDDFAFEDEVLKCVSLYTLTTLYFLDNSFGVDTDGNSTQR